MFLVYGPVTAVRSCRVVFEMFSDFRRATAGQNDMNFNASGLMTDVVAIAIRVHLAPFTFSL